MKDKILKIVSKITPFKEKNTGFWLFLAFFAWEGSYDMMCSARMMSSRSFLELKTASNSVLQNNEYYRKKIILHELGHALKLAHPKDDTWCEHFEGERGSYSSDNCVTGIMNPNPILNNTLTCCLPKYHDIINLKNKWGS